MTDNFPVEAKSSPAASESNSGTAKPAVGYIGWALPSDERERLLGMFPQLYPDLVAHHVTLAFGVPEGTPLPTETEGKVIGYADNYATVEALVFEVGGTMVRPDGNTFHCTWSLDRAAGAKPFHSNRVISAYGFTRLTTPIPVRLEPRFFK